MRRLLNLGVSDPLTLGMAHPIADRLETLGRARPTTWRSRCLALSTMGVLAITTAPVTSAESAAKMDVNLGHTITVIPDMTDTKIADLKSRMEKLSTGEADKEIVTEFMMLGIDKFVANYDEKGRQIDIKFGIPISSVREVLDTMPKWLERCQNQKSSSAPVMRTRFSWGSASVQCTVLPLPKRSAEQEKQ